MPSPAMLTVAALVRNEDDLKNDGNTTTSSDTDVTTQRANVVRAATYAKNRQAVFSLSEALLGKGGTT